jgi:hypothetical protein
LQQVLQSTGQDTQRQFTERYKRLS